MSKLLVPLKNKNDTNKKKNYAAIVKKNDMLTNKKNDNIPINNLI